MDIQYMPSSFSLQVKGNRNSRTGTTWPRSHQQNNTVCFKSMITYYACAYCKLHNKRPSHSWKVFATKTNKRPVELTEQPLKTSKKKGTIAGAVALIIGTTIGSGILALPKKTSPAGIVPSSVSMTVCWAFLLIEALLLVEINVGLLRKKEKRVEEDEMEIISIKTMAQETLGDWGGTLATISYVFLGYTSLIAYSSKSGEILYHLINLPEPISGFFFTALFTILMSIGGTQTTDQINQFLTASMIGLLLAIEVLAVGFGGWSGLEGSGDWGKVPATIPVIIFSLVYHDLTPVLCAYLGYDLRRIRTSVLIGSVVPLLALLVWDAIALGLSSQADQVSDPVELFMRVKWSGVSSMVEAFSLLAVGTSMIGTILSFSQFFKEQLSYLSPRTQILQKPSKLFGIGKWWGRNKVRFAATAMAVAPSLVVSTTVPDAFSTATDIAGAYCMTMLYGVLPPAMAWAMHHRESKDTDQKGISGARPALIGVGLFACGIVMEQLLQDVSIFHP